MTSTNNRQTLLPQPSLVSTRASYGASPVPMASGEKCVSRDFTMSLGDILTKPSDEINGHHHNKMDDNTCKN